MQCLFWSQHQRVPAPFGQDPQGARRHSEGGHHPGCPPCQEKVLLWLKGTTSASPPGLAHRAHLSAARGSAQVLPPRPAQTSVLDRDLSSPKKGEHLHSGELLLEHLRVFPLPSFSRSQMPIPFPPSPHLQLGFLGKETDGLSQRSHHVPSPPPFAPNPLPFKSLSNAVAMVTVQGRLAASCRPQIQHLGNECQGGWPGFGSCSLDANGTLLAYASWTSRCLCGVQGSKPGHPHPIPHPTSSTPGFRAQPLSAATGPWYLPHGFSETVPYKNPSLSLHRPPTARTPRWAGVINVCLGLGSGLTSCFTFRDEKKTRGKKTICC